MLPEARLPDGTPTSALGFGCSALVGGRTRREALRLLDAAFDAGIRHYDVARVYGTGDAEAVLGEFARGRREELTIASKFGIEPPGGGAAGTLGKGLVRALTRRSRRALRLARRHGGRTVRRGAFEPGRARASLAASLAALGTTRLDALLLHDCRAADWRRPGLREALEEIRAAGRIGCFGPASTAATVREILSVPEEEPPRIVQLGVDLSAEEEGEPGAPVDTRVTHGVYRLHLAALRTALAAPGAVAERAAALDLDLASGEVLGDLLLALALQRNRGGIVLVSASTPERIARNAACAESSPFAPAQLDAFAAVLREALGPVPAAAAAGR